MSWFGESNAHKQWRYQRDTNEQLQGFNLENMEIQQGYNLENMARQFDYNVQAFNMENEYNSPLAQRLRMSQAGLNPNWSDGSAIGQMDSGVNSSTPSGGAPGNSSMPTANPTQDMLALGEAYQGIMESRSRIALNEAEKHKAESEALVNKVNAENLPDNYQSTRSLQGTQNLLNRTMTDLYDAQKDAQLEANNWISREKDAIVKELMSKYHLNEQQAWDLANSFETRMKNLTAETNKFISSSFKDYQDVQYNRQYIKYLNGTLEVSRQGLAEMKRYHLDLTSVQRQANAIQSRYVSAQQDYLKSQSKYIDSLANGQDIKNKIWDMDMALRAYSRHNHIDSRLLNAQLEALHNQGALLYEQIQTQKMTQDEIDNRILMAPFSIFGEFSNYGVNENVNLSHSYVNSQNTNTNRTTTHNESIIYHENQ